MLSVSLLFSLNAFAQDCTPETLRQKPGTWKAGMAGSVKNIGAADLAKEKAVMAAIHKMIFAKYKPTGSESYYSSTYGKHVVSGQKWVADPYYYSLYVLRYICNKSDKEKSGHYVNTESPTRLTISANVYFPIDLYPVEPVDGPRGYLGLKMMPVKKDGYYFMGEEVSDGGGTPSEIREYRWLITYNDTLPFTYLTRKEYLLIQKKRLEQDIKDSPDSKSFNETYMKSINAYLARPEAELNQTAIYDPQEEQRFKSFLNEGTPGSRIAVKPNLAYYNEKLPKSTPHFFSIEYKVSKLSPIYTDNMEAIMKAVDFAMLKNMLGK